MGPRCAVEGEEWLVYTTIFPRDPASSKPELYVTELHKRDPPSPLPQEKAASQRESGLSHTQKGAAWISDGGAFLKLPAVSHGGGGGDTPFNPPQTTPGSTFSPRCRIRHHKRNLF